MHCGRLSYRCRKKDVAMLCLSIICRATCAMVICAVNICLVWLPHHPQNHASVGGAVPEPGGQENYQ